MSWLDSASARLRHVPAMSRLIRPATVYLATRSVEAEPSDLAISACHWATSVGGTTTSVAREPMGALTVGASGGRPRVASTRLTTSSVLPSPISSASTPPRISGGAASRISPSCGE
eukprot:scaffold48063_cov28-Tisochrysis_lutea.AAC.2